MPKLDLSSAVQIKGASGEIIALKGDGFSWTKPVVDEASLNFIMNVFDTPPSGDDVDFVMG